MTEPAAADPEPPDDEPDDPTRRTDRAYHLARTIARFRATISPDAAERLALILTDPADPYP